MMSLFSHEIIGLEISREGVGGALLRRDKGLPVLEQTFFTPFPPNSLRLSRSELHLMNPVAFVQQLKRLRRSVPSSVSRVALSLPDEVGRTVLLDLDETWKNRAEAVEMILWKLKKKLPHEAPDLHLDFQVLLRREGVPSLVLATFVARQIIEQYENLLYESGFQPAWIDLHQINLLRAFAEEIGHEGIGAFVSWYGENLGVVIMHDGIPFFWRSKYLPVERGNGEHLDQELHGSLEAYHKQWPEQHDVRACFFSPFGQTYLGLLSSLWQQTPIVLEYGSLYQQGGAARRTTPPERVVAAIAAAAGRL
mgnify:FL=1